VIVIAIIAVLAAIAVVRLSSASSVAKSNSAEADRALLQQAIDRYHAEHGEYPDDNRIARQLTAFTDVAGVVSSTRSTQYCFGPYLQKIPPAPTGQNAGSAVIGGRSTSSAGWLYSDETGRIEIWSAAPGRERD
jgi:type II secretory pathway pseudopilin PulG